MTIGGRAYLNFMGNEFGHPERVEFPMPSNNFSFSLANRRWIFLPTRDCIATCLPSIRYQLPTICFHLITLTCYIVWFWLSFCRKWLCNCSSCC
ncbi:putative 1,4-alpha-glucan branching enzyme [Rosa chinensis]|uniref:Putative 1,4-alpha-glucan branching enzyme n=1 Tax=Rosa chinensis TaxID=74649 RepID=A0A2P6Q545_ROSCH|nr:putative 1,4-alpha-glucan branching enzyme [Rosa chinensis]